MAALPDCDCLLPAHATDKDLELRSCLWQAGERWGYPRSNSCLGIMSSSAHAVLNGLKIPGLLRRPHVSHGGREWRIIALSSQDKLRWINSTSAITAPERQAASADAEIKEIVLGMFLRVTRAQAEIFSVKSSQVLNIFMFFAPLVRALGTGSDTSIRF